MSLGGCECIVPGTEREGRREGGRVCVAGWM